MGKKTILGLLTVALLTGCAQKNGKANTYGSGLPDNYKEPQGYTPPNASDTNRLVKDFMARNDLLANNRGECKGDNCLPSDLIIKLNEGNPPPPALRNTTINNLNLADVKLGMAIKMILPENSGVGWLAEPNIDLGRAVYANIVNLDAFEAIKEIAQSAGYGAYYSSKSRSIVITPWAKRVYRIPRGLLNTTGATYNISAEGASAITPEFEVSDGDTRNGLLDLIDGIGSGEKIVKLDRQSGELHISERPAYIEEIDSTIKRWVASRMRQFQVEVAVVQLEVGDENAFGLDIGEVLTKDGIAVTSLGGKPINSNQIASTVGAGGIVIGGGHGDYNSMFGGGADSLTNPKSKVSLKWLLESIQKNNKTEIVSKPSIMVQNHTVRNLFIGRDVSYIKTITRDETTNAAGGVDASYTPEIANYRDGIEISVRVDAPLGDENLHMTIVPSISSTTLKEVIINGTPVNLPDRQIKVGDNVISVKSGDIIVIAGMKEKKRSELSNKPLLSRLPLLGRLFGYDSEAEVYTETAFIVKVEEISMSGNGTLSNPSWDARRIYRENIQ